MYTYKMLGFFVESPSHLLRVIFIAPPSIASNFFFGETNTESSLQIYFLFHPSVVGGFRVSFTKKNYSQ